MQKHEALAQIDGIIDDLSNGELFDAVGEEGFLLGTKSKFPMRIKLKWKGRSMASCHCNTP